jgi:MFS family permease
VAGRTRLIWRVAVDPSLRRIEIAYAGFSLAEHATWLAVLVYAFSRGGVTETGAVATVLLVGAVIAAPFSAYAGDRFSPGRALSIGSFV